MYSLNDITNGCPIKVESAPSSCNGHNSEVISINGMPVVKTEKFGSPCKTVSQETISLPQEIIYEVPSLGEINTEEDVLNIQISNVQGATSDQNVVKNEPVTSNYDQLKNSTVEDEQLAFNQTASPMDKPSDQKMQPRFEVDPNTKSPLAESIPDEQMSKNMVRQEERYPVETEVRASVNQSNILNGDPLTETAGQERGMSFSLNSHEPEILPSNRIGHPPSVSQISNQYPSSTYQISTNGTLSPYQADTQGTLSAYQNGTPEIASTHQMTTNIPSVYMTTPLYHMATHGVMPGSQLEANMYYQMNQHNDLSAYHGGYNSHSPQLTKPLSHGMISNQQRGTHSCNCCCHAQNESSHYPAFGLEAPRPSVIMVPVNRPTAASALSHVPFKVDSSPYMMPLKNLDYSGQDFADQRMEYSDDSDSSDDDGNRKQKKYFRKNIDGTTARFKLTKEDWARIPINTFPSGGRLLSGDWTRIFLSKVKESNPWCSLRFKNNHVRSENSRKIHSAVFFRGGAECKRPECNVKVRFVIRKEKGKHVDVTYVGDVCHDSQPGRSDVLDDRKRKKIVRRTCSS